MQKTPQTATPPRQVSRSPETWGQYRQTLPLRVRIKNVTKKTINYMKKVYVSPLATEVNVEATNMLAASLKLDNNKTVDTSNGGQLSGGHRGQWGNLWN